VTLSPRVRSAARLALALYGLALLYHLTLFIFGALFTNAYTLFTSLRAYELFWRADWFIRLLLTYLPPVIFLAALVKAPPPEPPVE